MKTLAKYIRPKTRTDDIHLRVTPGQKEFITMLAQSCELTVTQLICEALIEGAVPVINRADPEELRHKAMIGNLLNQIAEDVTCAEFVLSASIVPNELFSVAGFAPKNGRINGGANVARTSLGRAASLTGRP